MSLLLTDVSKQLAGVAEDIIKVEKAIAAVEVDIAKAEADKNEKKVERLYKEKEQLRKEKEQLRKKEEQLRDQNNLLLQAQVAQAGSFLTADLSPLSLPLIPLAFSLRGGCCGFMVMSPPLAFPPPPSRLYLPLFCPASRWRS